MNTYFTLIKENAPWFRDLNTLGENRSYTLFQGLPDNATVLLFRINGDFIRYIVK